MSWNNQIPYLSRTYSWLSSSRSNMNSRESHRTNLIINNLPNSMTENELYSLFVTIGPIESCKIMRDIKTGYSYGFAFLTYVTEEHALRAIASFNGYQVQNKRLKVSFARSSDEEVKDTNLYVTNLPKTITEYQLDIIFGKYGNIVNKHILREKHNGMPKGIAFIRYDKREEAQEAISALNNVIPDGGTQPLNIRLAEEFNCSKYNFFYNNKNNSASRYNITRTNDLPTSASNYGRGSACDYMSDYNGYRGASDFLSGRNRVSNNFANSANSSISRGSLCFSNFGPGNFRSGSALSLTSGSMYGGLNSHLDSPQQSYYSHNSGNSQMYRAGYTGSLNRENLSFNGCGISIKSY